MPKSIAILAPSPVPFQLGGAEKFWHGLRAALAAEPDCVCELIKLPVSENSFAEIIESYKTFSEIDLTHFDLLITGKYPAWMARHPNHICYLLHPLRGLYDHYHYLGAADFIQNMPPALQDLARLIRKPMPCREDLPEAFELCKRALAAKSVPSALFALPGPLLREIVHFFDKIALAPGQIQAYYAISSTVARRKDYLPENAPVTTLYPPSDLSEFFCHKGEYLFTASRLNAAKRIHLIIDAMAYVPQNISLKIAGTGAELDNLRQRAANDPRIEFLGFVADADLPDFYAGAIAVPFVPLDEDYGLITVEAFMSGKPVVTTTDAGGVCELVKDGVTGFVTEPHAADIGKALARLVEDRALAARLGSSGRQSAEKISWPAIARELVSQGFGLGQRSKILVLSAFAADAHGAGGARRLYHLCSCLSARYDVELVCIGPQTQRTVLQRQQAQHFAQTSVPWPQESIADAEEILARTGISGNDIAIGRHAAADPLLRETITQKSRDCFCAIVSHPWLYEAVCKAAPDLPVHYEAQDVESDIKKGIFGAGSLADEVAARERQAATGADLVIACSEGDGAKLKELYAIAPEKIVIAANGCETPRFDESRENLRKRLPYPRSRLALFVASGHKPNQDAALAIFELANSLPDVEFLLAGTVSTQAAIRQAQRPANVHLLGMVSEKVKNLLLYACDLAINPVTSGSGTNLKLVEYLACGLPCISTPFGARGLDGDYEPALTICGLENFAVAIGDYFARPPEREAVEEISRKIAREFAWPTVMQPLCAAIGQRDGSGYAPAN